MGYQVIVWDNTGTRSVVPCQTMEQASEVAKSKRTMDNRTVKIADAFGSTFHWSRSTHLHRNHWSSRAVDSSAFV